MCVPILIGIVDTQAWYLMNRGYANMVLYEHLFYANTKEQMRRHIDLLCYTIEQKANIPKNIGDARKRL